MKKIVHLPLDERPCNYDFPFKMFNKGDIKVVRPDKEDMGFKKEPGDIKKLHEFLLKETQDAYGLVISIDTLLFGGIVPSRSHFFEEEFLETRLKVLEQVKQQNPNIVIHAYDLIMRTPRYNDDEEEPDYYRYAGMSIFEKGFLEHKKELGLASPEELDKLDKIVIEPRYLKDYLRRRNINTNLTLKSVDLVDKGIINFLVIPQDDSAEFGWTAKDQVKVRTYIEKKNLQNKIYIYPGADEVGSILFARMANKIFNRKPKMYIKYPSITSGIIIPTLEDRFLDTSVKYQITAAGGVVVSSISEADMVVFVNAPSDWMLPSSHQHVKHKGYTTQRNLVEFVETMEYVITKLNKPVTLADLGFDNGGDIELVKMLNKKDLLLKLASYASWNIPCNALGTAIAFGVSYLLFGRTIDHQSFLVHRFLEDVGYCSHTRYHIRTNVVASHGYNIYFIGEQRGTISKIVQEEIEKFINANLTTLKGKYEILDCFMPWVRTYEVGLEVKYIGKI
ncbi:MAG: DUF4127 family protein [Acholeplasmataceae bacterium]|jgi:hypothetical protein